MSDNLALVHQTHSSAMDRVHEDNSFLSNGSSQQQQDHGNELRKIHRALRGRYHWVVLLGLIGAAAGAYLGFRMGQKTFQSTGQIHISAVLPKVMYETENKGVPPMFEAYLDSQVDTLRNAHIMTAAMQDPQWVHLRHQGNDINGHLEVSRQGEMISVRGIYTDPEVAQTTVQTVLQSYEKFNEDEEARSEEQKLKLLQEKETNLGHSLQEDQVKVREIAKAYGTVDLNTLWKLKLEKVDKLETSINDLNYQIRSSETIWPADAIAKLTPSQIAVQDPQMALLLPQELAAKKELLILQMKLLDENPEVRIAQESYDLAKEAVEERANEYRAGLANNSGAGANGGISAARKEYLQALRDQAKTATEELHALGENLQTLNNLNQEIDSYQKELELTRGRMAQLNLENRLTGRIEVISDGDRPEPYRDTHQTFAAAGGLGGAMIGVGLVIALAFMDRRIRTPDEAETHAMGARILGVLPKLPDNLADPHNATLAAHCVHEIRTKLQIEARGDANNVLAVTSPVAGTGKTTLSFALGLAFASSGQRTLLIDCDLVGGGLSDRAHSLIRSRLGSILLRENVITSEQLAKALAVAKRSKRGVGEALVELGFATRDQVATAAVAQSDGRTGMLDVLRGMDPALCITDTGIKGLSILPLGEAASEHVPLVTPQVINQLLAQARKHFSMVIIDTGPLSGSLEASVVTSVADGVILTVSRGEQRAVFDRCIRHLQSMGATVAGVVFNRANWGDLVRYSGSVSSSLRSSRPSQNAGGITPGPAADEMPLTLRFGPVARAVASYSGTPTPPPTNEK